MAFEALLCMHNRKEKGIIRNTMNKTEKIMKDKGIILKR